MREELSSRGDWKRSSEGMKKMSWRTWSSNIFLTIMYITIFESLLASDMPGDILYYYLDACKKRLQRFMRPKMILTLKMLPMAKIIKTVQKAEQMHEVIN